MTKNPSFLLPFEGELVVDLFAGGGGASLGIARAYREPDVAVNHDPVAIGVHAANHGSTTHYTCDVFEVDPVQATGGRPVGLLWASPDCRHHSKAKGGKPRSKRVRGLAWVVVKWADRCKPSVIELENVEEFADWGPLLADGSPCKVRKGITFRRWVRQLERLGYVVEHRELIAADYGAPTIRKRLYVSARCDGRPIAWPKPTHSKTGAGGLPKWRTAAECIDFTLPSKSIFDRPRPLVKNTCRRVAKGAWRYVLTAAQPFIVKTNHTAAWYDQFRGQSIAEPLQTVTGSSGFAIAEPVLAPFLTEHANASNQRVFPADEPLRTQCAQVKGGHFAMAAAHLAHLTHHDSTAGNPVDAPLRTVTAAHRGEQALVTTWMEQANTGQKGKSIDHPLSTICTAGSHQQLCAAYMVKFFREGGQWAGCNEPMHTITTKDRMGLVEIVHVPADILAPELRRRAKQVADFLHEHLPEHFPEPADMVLLGDYVLVDITLRMLTPRELARAQGFPDSYVIEFTAAGKTVTKTDQVRLIGNSVCPDVAEAIIRAQLADLVRFYQHAKVAAA